MVKTTLSRQPEEGKHSAEASKEAGRSSLLARATQLCTINPGDWRQ